MFYFYISSLEYLIYISQKAHFCLYYNTYKAFLIKALLIKALLIKASLIKALLEKTNKLAFLINTNINKSLKTNFFTFKALLLETNKLIKTNKYNKLAIFFINIIKLLIETFIINYYFIRNFN
jgi:hypothetical protein